MYADICLVLLDQIESLSDTNDSIPLIVPSNTTHTHTFIVLHGRGSNAHDFGPRFSSARTSAGHTLQELFPGVKLVFPTAKKRRAALYNRAWISQWFDNPSLDNPTERQEIMYDGLRESSGIIRGLIQEEAKLVGANNVVLVGLSQGSETWPYDTIQDDDPFGGSEGKDEDSLSKQQLRAANFARDICDLSMLPLDGRVAPAFSQVPVFLGHGTEDDKVRLHMGKQAYSILERLQVPVTWKTYEFGHWWKEPEEIDDIVNFLQEKVGLHTVKRD
ncbi:alpha/beta-hydrolase [Mytilinidion resinicola]|uniref:Alpha/beta-hydrolase n=1 Tax=Mytilinidion resinicola TaxID=574789 RepID=A0A6A6YPI8_9PEZI|nr:alpha/beta-hydrolase [Mytilinidion resinicola]KAF2809934.1 alpha/beta-hydrolase [Mytilinidion resinicola]